MTLLLTSFVSQDSTGDSYDFSGDCHETTSDSYGFDSDTHD